MGGEGVVRPAHHERLGLWFAPLILSWSKDGVKGWFDKLTMSGTRLTMSGWASGLSRSS